MAVKFTLISNCTQRKSVSSEVEIAQVVRFRNIEQLADEWQRLVKRADARRMARSLYQGRSVTDTAAVVKILNGQWYFVSAGLGLLESEEFVPSYDCTVAAGSELVERITSIGATVADWWSAIVAHRGRSISHLVSESKVLLSLPSSYLRMIRDDLSRINVDDSEKLRIFTSAAGSQYVPAHLSPCVMPYDDRLESVTGYAGTQSDFAQRALRHFVEALGAASLPLEESRTSVTQSMETQVRRKRPVGRRLSDEEILVVLKAQWSRHSGSSSRLLRYLRDEARISCEQRRFSRLWQGLSTELRTQGVL